MRKSGTADSYNGIQHQEGLIKDGFEKAEKLNIPFPSVVRTFISAIPQDFKRVWLTNCFLFSSNLSKEEAKKIAEEYGIDNFDLSDWWEMPG